MRLSRPILALVILVLAVAPCRADVITLRGSGTLEGEIVAEDADGYTIRLASGGETRRVPRRLVLEVKRSVVELSGATGMMGTFELGPRPTAIVPEAARLGGPSAPVETAEVPVGFKTTLDELLATTSDATLVTAWVKEKATGRVEVAYVVRLMQSYAGSPELRRALWRGWVQLEPADQAETRLLPYARSDLREVRLDTLFLLRDHATWRSLPVLLDLIDLPHVPSSEAALAVVLELTRRAPPKAVIVDGFVTNHRTAREAGARGRLVLALAAMAEVGSRRAADYLKRVREQSRDPAERARLLEPIARGLHPTEAHELFRAVLAGREPLCQMERTVAARALPRFSGTLEDVPAVMALDDEPVALEVVPVLARRASFASAAELRAWWGRVREPLASWRALVARLGGSRPEAVAALEALLELRLPAIDAALRATAATSRSSDVRAAAALAVARRGDTKGAPAVLAALRQADAGTRDAVGSALRLLARGETLPLANAAKTLGWWRSRFPEDFED